jgi:ABC-type multidrug transport system ATPase subunit
MSGCSGVMEAAELAGALLDIEGLQARRGARAVLRDVHVHVPAGEVCGLLGPNGAGKTTTIAAAIGLLAPDAGRVELHPVCPDTDLSNREPI